MRILVTGGAGFIGSHCVEALLTAGHQVVVIDNLSAGKREYVHPQATLVEADIRSDDWPEKVGNFEAVIHLAAQKNLRTAINDPLYDADINIIGGLKVLQAAHQHKARFIFASSAAVYGVQNGKISEAAPVQPVNPYGITKLTMEMYLQFYQQTYDLPVTILRFSNAYGPRQDPLGEAGVLSLLLNAILGRGSFTLNGDGLQTRDFIFVTDLTSALTKGLEHEGIYNIGTGVEHSLLEAISLIEGIHGSKLDYAIGQAITGEVRTSVFDSTKAKDQLDWQASVALEQGLRQTYDWMKSV